MVKGELEFKCLKQGLRIAGADEVGRGCLAGPVYAACAKVDYDKLLTLPEKVKSKIRDSKTLSAKQRHEMIPILTEICVAFVAFSSVKEIETLGIVPASFLAMKRAISKFEVFSLDHILVDGNKPISGLDHLSQETIVRGDSLCYNIAAASIFAKEARDRYMKCQALEYPKYGFETNVGYGTKQHLSAIEFLGATPLHRMNFSPLNKMIPSSHP